MVDVGTLMANGYYVYPATVVVDERGKKRVHVKGTWKDSTRDRGNLDWFTETGVIVDCEKSGIVAIDLDQSNGKDGLGNLRAAGIPLPPTPMRVRTWSGGLHGYYRQDPDALLDSSQGKPVRDVDVRGLGGIVFGPGTTVCDGSRDDPEYKLLTPLVPVSELPLLTPEFVRAVLAAGPSKDYSESTLEPFTGELSPSQEEDLEQWYGLDLDEIRNASSGERHRALLSNASKILDRGSKLGYGLDKIRDDIQGAYEDSGGSEWEEKRAIIDWSLGKLKDDPMGVPPDRADPEGLRREALIRLEQDKIEIRREAQRRAQVGGEIVDVGRVLGFDEPEGSLYGEAWVSRVLPKGETVILFGERYHGKSVFGLDLGLSVASGTDWHGHKTEIGNVLYLAGEGTIGLPARRRSWVEHHSMPNPARLHLRDRVVQLGVPASVAAFQAMIVEHEIDLVIVDTLKRAARGLDIADPGVAQEMVESLDDLRRVRHGCTALVLHHPTKSNPTEPAGGGTLQDAVSVIHHLVKDAYGNMTLTTTKLKDGPDGVVGEYHLEEVAGSVILTANAGSVYGQDRTSNTRGSSTW